MTNVQNKIQATKTVQHCSLKLFSYLPLIILLFGILIRLVQYISNRSLWADEASIALNITHRSYLELLQPLDHNQVAPPGFLWMEKLALQVFGNNEYAFRLFPLIAGIISLVAFYQLGQWAVSPIAFPIAMTLFACLWYPFYYATEAKPYSSDVMVALLLSLLLVTLRGRILRKAVVLLLGIAGTISMWFSYPAIFTLGGVEIANLITAPKGKWKAILINRWIAYYIWIISFGVLYFWVIAGAMQNQALQNSWSPEYPKSIFDIPWLLESFKQFFSNPLGFHGISEEAAIVAFVIGFIAFFRQNRIKLLILTSPVLATLVATYFHKYPFRTRLIFFLTPFFILIISEGIAYLLSQIKHRKYIAIIGIAIGCIVLLPPSVEAGRLIFHPQVKRAMRPVVEYTRTHQRPGDMIYVDAGSSPDQFKYYAEKYGYSEFDYIFGYNDFLISDQFSEQRWKDFQYQSGKLKSGQRVWFVFSGLNKQEKMLVKPRLDQLGQELDRYDQSGALTYLYQLK